ncbi:MAG: superoxide dismutase [Deltaproteobacteria bacterium]|nr:superoxide dismutase [Deltaproteobacteria bacterium]
MKILAIEKEYAGKTAEDFQPYLETEAIRVWELYKKGVIREIHFRADRTSAVLILECKNLEEAKEKLSTLPLVQENLIYFDFIPLAPYPGFERLFKAK